MNGISPSDLPWWGWMLCGFGLVISGWIVGKGQESEIGFLRLIFSITLYATGAGCEVLGIFRLVKWEWTGMF